MAVSPAAATGQTPVPEPSPVADVIRGQAASMPARTSSPQTFGTSQPSFQRVGSMAFAPATSPQGYSFLLSPGFKRFSTSPGSQAFLAHPVLPSGAQVTSVDFAVCDSHATADVQVVVLSDDSLGEDLHRRPDLTSVLPVRRGTRCFGNYCRLWGRQLLSRQSLDARTERGLPGEGAGAAVALEGESRR
jgi:hypothetical protein